MEIPFLKKSKQPEPRQQPLTSPPKELGQGMVDVKDLIDPPDIEVDFNHLKICNRYCRT